MPIVNITTMGDRNGANSFKVDQATVNDCIGKLTDPNAVLVLREQEGTGYIPVRHVTAMWVNA
jgi:hypothetical protein